MSRSEAVKRAWETRRKNATEKKNQELNIAVQVAAAEEEKANLVAILPISEPCTAKEAGLEAFPTTPARETSEKLARETNKGRKKTHAKRKPKAAVRTPVNATPKFNTKKGKEAMAAHGCWCGCGAQVTKQFAQGHDARLKGLLIRVAAGKADSKEIPAPVLTIWRQINFIVADDRLMSLMNRIGAKGAA